MSASTGTRLLRQIAGDLWETPPDSPFPGLTTHAYVLRRPGGGNVLFYSVATNQDLDEIDRLGGLTDQYLSHRDEAGPMLSELHRRFGLRLHAHAAEEDDVARHRSPSVLFSERHRDGNGVEVIPTPGHSPGSTCFAVDGTEGRYLFVGDTIFRGEDGEWTAGFIRGISDAALLSMSLGLLNDLEPPDLVISSAFAGDAGVHEVDAARWAHALEEARRSLTG